MNFPEITSELKQGLRSESVSPVQAVARAPVRNDESKPPALAVNAHDANNSEKPRAISKEDVTALAARIEKKLDASNVKLKFNVVEENDTVQIEILNSEGKTIRKIPSDDMLKLSKSLEELDRGFLDTIS
jgi:FlaG protein.